LPENGVIGFSVKRFGGFGCMLCRTLKLMIAYIQIYSFTRHRDVQKKKDGALLQQCPPNDRSVTYKIIQNYEKIEAFSQNPFFGKRAFFQHEGI